MFFNIPPWIKAILWIVGGLVSLWTVLDAFRGYWGMYKEYGNSVRIASHYWWTASPVRSTFSVALVGAAIIGTAFYLFARHPPLETPGLITPINVESYLKQWGHVWGETVQDIPPTKEQYFLICVALSDNQPICLIRPKDRDSIITFRVGVAVGNENVFNRLSESEQFLFYNELQNDWLKQGIPCSGELPTGPIEVIRRIPIAELNENRFFDTMNKMYSDASIITTSITIGLSRRIKGLVPLPRKASDLTYEDVVEISKLLSSVRPPVRLAIEAESRDPDSVKVVSVIGSLFKTSGYEVKAARLVPNMEKVSDTTIAVYLMNNAPDELVTALAKICNRLNKHVIYRQRVEAGYVQILVGDP